MKININDLEKIILLLLHKLKESKGNEIELNNDFFWDIPSDELYNPYEDPKNITLGQLTDEVNEIMRLMKADEAIAYDLKRVASILTALSIENPIAF